MAKSDIKKLLDEATRSLHAEYESYAKQFKSELQSFKTKTLDKIQKTIP